MAVKVVLGYLAVAANGETSFSVSWDDASNSFAVDGDLNAATNNISRLDFLDPATGAPLVIIPCVAQGSSFQRQSSNLYHFNLPLNSLLGGPANLAMTGYLCATQGQLYFATPAQIHTNNGGRSLEIGGEDTDPINTTETASDGEYNNLLAGLSAQGPRQGGQWIDDPAIKVPNKNTPTPFGACFGHDFYSDHITCHVRYVDTSREALLPVLTIRRQFSLNKAGGEQAPLLFPPPFALAIPTVNGPDTNVHATQFPTAAWLNSGPNAALLEETIWRVEISGFSGKTINQFWSESVVTPYVAGLAAVNDVLPVSLLPSLQLAPSDGDNQDFFWRLCATVSLPARAGDKLTLSSLRLIPGGALAPEQPAGPYTNAVATLDAFRTQDGAGMPLTAAVGLDADFTNQTPDGVGEPVRGDAWYSNPFGNDTYEIHFTLQIQSFAPALLRLGALDLSLGQLVPPAPPVIVSQLECIVTFATMTLHQQFLLGGATGPAWFPQVYVNGRLPVFHYTPAGEDNLPQTASDAILDDDLTPLPDGFDVAAQFKRDAAIVFDLSGGSRPNARQLEVLESSRSNSNAPHSQQLVFRLKGDSNRAGFGPVMVLDRQQFLVAKVELTPTNSASTGDEIGVWCNLFPEGPGWRISGGASGFKLQLPPQAIGEEMERISGDIPEGTLVNYRYSPAFTANLLGSYNPQNYVQPPWDLRSVLGYAQQRAPGAGVDPSAPFGVRFELMHGITTSLTALNLRLSEIFARLGDFPGPMPTTSELQRIHPEFREYQKKAVTAMAKDWSLHYRQLLSRPAVLELWNDQQGADLLLDDGVTCVVRPNALYGYQPPNPPKGLAAPLHAGVGAALESDNLIAELSRNLNSTSAHLARPRFSALGGWGDQKASFAKGKIIVESHTAMGRLSGMSVTLVGRIGCFWNRALHVTVYERTVRPSRQFYLEQDELSGRPILRKVREYVKILEPMRNYPEASASPVTRGFVAGSIFKSTTINVDSTWGGDVGSSGWQVPLWNPNAVPIDIYPRPHINLSVEIDPAVGVDTMLAEILDPQKLCFYTDTSDDTTSDTDTWSAVQEIDFVDAPPLRTIGDVPQALTAWKSAGQDPSVEPGFGRFTYHVAPIAGQTNLVAQRTASAIGASLKTVSMMRGNPVAGAITPDTNDARQASGRVRDWWTGMVHQLRQTLNSNDPASAVKDLLTTNASGAGLIDQLNRDLQAIAHSIPDPCAALSGKLLQGVGKLTASAQTALAQVLTGFGSDLKNQLNTLAGQAGTTTAQLETLVNNIFKTLATTLAPFTGDLATAAATLTSVSGDFKAKVGDAAKNLHVGDADLLADVQAFQAQIDFYSKTMNGVCRVVVGNAGNQVTAAIPLTLPSNLAKLVTDIKAGAGDIAASLATIQQQIATLQTAVDTADGLCQAAATALKQAKPELETELGAMHDALIKLIDKAPADLQKELNVFYQQNAILSANVEAQAAQIAKWVSDLTKDKSTSLCQAFALPITNVVNGLIDTLHTEALGVLSGLASDANAFNTALADIEANVASQLDAVYHQVTASLPSLKVPTFVVPGTALQLLRAFGDPPQVPTTSFNLPSLAYFFNDSDLKVLMTNVETGIAQAAQGLGNLGQFGLSMPSVGLLDRVLPPDLTSFDISRIFPKFAGLDLAGLFQGVTLPAAANQNIHVAHHIDPQTRRATLDADIDIPLAGSSTIFDIGPVCLNLLDADLQAHVHVSAGIGQQTVQTSRGSITGDWEMRVGGMVLVTFLDTTLSFDESGTLHFSLKPSNVQLAAALQFVTEFLSAFDFGDSGFTLNILPAPPKVQCILDLPLPDMGGGTFAIMNLRLGALLEIGIDETGFYATVGANLGRQIAPFDLTIFILGGAGWFETSVTYRKGQITGSVTVGMAASAALELSLGPISGSVAIYFGIFANLQIGSGGGFQLGIMILITGQVSLLGIIDVNIALLLEAEYTSGGGLTGRGTVSMSIKICWCFTLSVHQSVQYTFGASQSNQQAPAKAAAPAVAPAIAPAAARVAAALAAPPDPDYPMYQKAAQNYVNMLA